MTARNNASRSIEPALPAVTRTAATAPEIGKLNWYNLTSATEGWTITLPALSGVPNGATLVIGRLDSAFQYGLFVECASGDELQSGATSIPMFVAAEQVTLTARGTYWAIEHNYIGSNGVLSLVSLMLTTISADDILDGSTYKRYSATEQTKLSGLDLGTTVQPMIPNGTCSTAVGTAAKTMSLNSPWNGRTPTAGDFYILTFTNGNSAASPTLALNGDTARAIRTPSGGTASTSLTLAAGTTVLVVFNGTEYITMGPTANTVGVSLTGTETLTNKTLTSPLLDNPTIKNYTEQANVVGSSGSAKTISLANGTVVVYSLDANCTFTMPTPVAGKSFVAMLYTSGSFTATFTGVKWPGGTAPTFTTGASKMDMVSFFSDGTNWYGSVAQNYSVV